MKLFIAFSVLAALAPSSYAKKSCSVPAIPRNVTILQPGVPIIPGGRVPQPNTTTKVDQIVDLFQRLGRTTKWTIAQRILLEGFTGEPEGMVHMGDRYFVSAGMYTESTKSYGNGTIINGTDRTPGVGVGHLLVFDGKGKRLADVALTKPGDMEYHVGGISFDGEYIWSTIAQYRPNSTAHIARINPLTLNAERMFSVNDHEGGIIHDPYTNQLLLLNWGSRNASTWQLNKHCESSVTHVSTVRNPLFFLDYQDCKFLGHPHAYNRRAVMLCGGVTTLPNSCTVGGMAIVDMETMVALDEVPMMMLSDLGTSMTQNPIDIDVIDDKLTFYLAPDQNTTTVYVVQAETDSPYEF